MNKIYIVNSDNDVLSILIKKHYHYDFLVKELVWTDPKKLPEINKDTTTFQMFFNTKKESKKFIKWFNSQKKNISSDYTNCDYKGQSLRVFDSNLSKENYINYDHNGQFLKIFHLDLKQEIKSVEFNI